MALPPLVEYWNGISNAHEKNADKSRKEGFIKAIGS
jgi:hypothetical protein